MVEADGVSAIGRDAAAPLLREPVQYRLRQVEDRLVFQATNLAGEAIELQDDSAVHDPGGRAHVVPPRALGHGATLKLILPPLGPTRPGAQSGVAFDFGSPEAGNRRARESDPVAPAARTGEAAWSWPPGGRVRVALGWRVDGQTIVHDFVFEKVAR